MLRLQLKPIIRLPTIIARKCHTSTKNTKLSYIQYIISITAGHILLFSSTNAMYSGYKALVNNNKFRKTHHEYNNQRIIDDAIVVFDQLVPEFKL